MKRRDFLLTTSSFLLGGAVSSSEAAIGSLASIPQWFQDDALPYVNQLGLQLWTVRNQMAEDPDATLKAVAKAGYQQVELGSVLAARGDRPGARAAFAKAEEHGPKRVLFLIDYGQVKKIDHATRMSYAKLIVALDDGHLGHATLDTFRIEPLPEDHPFRAHPKVTVSPHVASLVRAEDADLSALPQEGLG